MSERYSKLQHSGLEWSDTTSYSRDDPEREPTCWTAKAGRFRLTVVSSHIYHKGKWIVHCDPFWDARELNASSKEEAMTLAVEILRDELTTALSTLGAQA